MRWCTKSSRTRGAKRGHAVRGYFWSDLAIAGLGLVSGGLPSPREARIGPSTLKKEGEERLIGSGVRREKRRKERKKKKKKRKRKRTKERERERKSCLGFRNPNLYSFRIFGLKFHFRIILIVFSIFDKYDINMNFQVNNLN